MPVKNVIRIVLVTALILLVPFLAMQFGVQVPDPGSGTSGVTWTSNDFVAAGILLLAAGFALDLVLRKAGKYRIVGAIAVVLAFFYVWAELAVGVFTNWGS